MNKKFTVGAIAGMSAIVIAVPALAQFANAASSSSISTSAAPQAEVQDADDAVTPQRFDRHKGGHIGANGKAEEILTGDTAAKVTAAAEAAVPGGTIDRVETDTEGDVYEAHMTKSDGSHVTVKFDANFNVTNIEDGPMGR